MLHKTRGIDQIPFEKILRAEVFLSRIFSARFGEERDMHALTRWSLFLLVLICGNQAYAQDPCSEPVVTEVQYIVESSAQPEPPTTVPAEGNLWFEFVVSSNCQLDQATVRFRNSAGDSDLYMLPIPIGAEAGDITFNGSPVVWGPVDGGFMIGVNASLVEFFGSAVLPGTYRLGLNATNSFGQSATLLDENTFDVTVAGPDPDTDIDGVPDSSDNCPDDINPDQADNDLDGMGDACDNDDDNDGVLDGVDNCPFDDNPDQTDVNGDGFGDVCVPTSSNIDPAADLDPSVDIGEDVQVDKGVQVGANSQIGDGASLDKNVEVGSNAEIGANVEMSQDVQIGDFVFVGEGAILDRGVVLCDNASVGAYAHIGRDSEVGYHGVVEDFEVIGKETFVPGPDPQPTSCTSP
jgi:carbonic anhydrase/acetyltransferase-like protein (isoleucine patch superfamily)